MEFDVAVAVPDPLTDTPDDRMSYAPHVLSLFVLDNAAYELEANRLRLHNLFQLPTNSPIFRVSQARDFNKQKADSQGAVISVMYCVSECLPPLVRLRNPHQHDSIHREVPKNMTRALVSGQYDYYHYMQDGINDNV